MTKRLENFEPKGAKTDKLVDLFHNKNVLFVIEKSQNTNCVIYEVNLDKSGKLKLNDPIKTYWIMYDTTPIVEVPLNMIERNTAYGHTITPVMNKPGVYSLKLVSFDKEVYIFIGEDGEYHAQIEEEGEKVELLNIFVQLTTFLGVPSVKYVDVTVKTYDGKVRKKRIENN